MIAIRGADRRGEGMAVDFTIVDSRQGRLLMASTERGVCAVYLGDGDTELEAALWDEYPGARIVREGGASGRWIAPLLQHLAGEQRHLDVPLDVPATPFQWRVWEALRAIPYGQTRTYRHIARTLGLPHAARAVGRACATNPVSVVVPCHRAVREDGGLAGYRWGIERKRALQDAERATAASTES